MSMVILPYYQGGDQVYYRELYGLLKDLNIEDGYKIYFLKVGATEPLSFLFLWTGSNLDIEKDILISFFNTILAYVIINLLIEWKVSLFIISLIILTNYYFIVMYTGAERLKFAFIFLILSIYNTQNLKKYLLFAILSHFQTLLVYASMFFVFLSKQILTLFKKGVINRNIIFIIILGVILISLFYMPILNKIEYYMIYGQVNIYKLLLFMLLTLFYARRKNNLYEVIFLFLFLIIMVSIVGEERVNLIGYFIFLYYALKVKKGINLGVLLTSMYFGIKSYEFMYNIIIYGNGFYGIGE